MSRSLPRGVAAGLLALLFTAGCGDDGPGDNQNTNRPDCPAGHQADGPACVPRFDDPGDCPGPNEMPALGGGCQAVGVTGCATGFAADDAGGCDAILPPAPCPPGTLELIGRDTCQPVGVTQCATGFAADGAGGCDAILPPEPCPPGTLEVIGHDTCQPVGDCGPEGSTWGLIAVDATTVYVDASADASGADGTVAAPFPTVGAALAVAPSGGQVAIAAGAYDEVLELDRPVRLEGRCSARVTLRGQVQDDEPRPALSLRAGGTGTEVRGVTLTGPGEGLQVTGARQVVIEAVEVRGAGGYGINLTDQSETRLRRVKVAECSTAGLRPKDSHLFAEQTVVQGTLPQAGSRLFGAGVVAVCTAADRCGSVRLDGSLVAGNRFAGVFAVGVDAEIHGSVVADTLPQESDDAYGDGIHASCDTDVDVCGSLWVEGSVVSGNRYVGIDTWGVEATVRDSVVRGTLAQVSDHAYGNGITAKCDPPVGACGSLRVEASLVTGNQQAGLIIAGEDVTVLASAISGTLPEEGSQTYGMGIYATCQPSLEVCGHLVVDGSLVTGNRMAGIATEGGDTTVRASVISGTLPQASDGTYGEGLLTTCDSAVGACGTLRVDGTLVTGNRDVGLFVEGVSATVRASVVRDTLPQQSDQTAGWGIGAHCHVPTGTCASLVVDGSLVTGNRGVGVITFGAEAEVRASVVSGTLPQASDQAFGRGIGAQCASDQGVCGSLLVAESLVTDNRGVGIITFGAVAEVRASVVSGTLPQESDQAFGWGIGAQCDPAVGVCGALTVDGSLVAGNRLVGLFVSGVDATVNASVVTETRPQESDHSGGRGLSAQCDLDLAVCGRLSVTESLVVHSEEAGIFILGVPADLAGVAVVDTATNAAGPKAGEYGQGIWAGCTAATGGCGALSLTACRVASGHGAGVALEGVSGFISRSLVDTVLAQPSGDRFGYGLQIGGTEGADIPTFHVRDCTLRDARLAGVLYYRAQGTLSGSVISGGEYCVAMNEGSAPTVAGDNLLACTVQSEPEWVSLVPSPSPPPTTPLPPFEE